MKRFIYFLLSLTFLSLIVLGCQEQNIKLSKDNDVLSISVKKSKDGDALILEEKKSLNSFQDIFYSAVKEDGIVDMSDPEYYLDIEFDKGERQRIYLWIGEEGQRSTFMNAEDTHTIYTVSPEMSSKLIKLIESHFD